MHKRTNIHTEHGSSKNDHINPKPYHLLKLVTCQTETRFPFLVMLTLPLAAHTMLKIFQAMGPEASLCEVVTAEVSSALP